VRWWVKNFTSGFIKESPIPAFLCWEYFLSTWLPFIGIRYPEKSRFDIFRKPRVSACYYASNGQKFYRLVADRLSAVEVEWSETFQTLPEKFIQAK
jgi:hypothetical protein